MTTTPPRPNAPNSLAWTLPLASLTPRPQPPKPRPGSRAARIALWTSPLSSLPPVTVQTRRVP